MIGALVGFLSYTWDSQSLISNFFITPISFFSGTFFSLDTIHYDWVYFLKLNPFYYLVKGFRSSFINEYTITYLNDVYLFFFFIIFLITVLFVFQKGYKVIS